MPIYVYECPKCKECAEINVNYAVREQTLFHPKCNTIMKRIIAPTNFILKGAGWAKDGYSKSKKKI